LSPGGLMAVQIGVIWGLAVSLGGVDEEATEAGMALLGLRGWAGPMVAPGRPRAAVASVLLSRPSMVL
jgi:hypothetical protein